MHGRAHGSCFYKLSEGPSIYLATSAVLGFQAVEHQRLQVAAEARHGHGARAVRECSSVVFPTGVQVESEHRVQHGPVLRQTAKASGFIITNASTNNTHQARGHAATTARHPAGKTKHTSSTGEVCSTNHYQTFLTLPTQVLHTKTPCQPHTTSRPCSTFYKGTRVRHEPNKKVDGRSAPPQTARTAVVAERRLSQRTWRACAGTQRALHQPRGALLCSQTPRSIRERPLQPPWAQACTPLGPRAQESTLTKG